MMLKTLAWGLLWVALFAGFLAVIGCEHRATNNGLPLVQEPSP